MHTSAVGLLDEHDYKEKENCHTLHAGEQGSGIFPSSEYSSNTATQDLQLCYASTILIKYANSVTQ